MNQETAIKPIEAHRWFQNGDHPKDEYEKGTIKEGKIVRRFRSPDEKEKGVLCCEKCGFLNHDHGFLDQGATSEKVCPGQWIIECEGNYFYPSNTVPDSLTCST